MGQLLAIIAGAWLLLSVLFVLFLMMRRRALRKLATISALQRLAPAMSLGKHWVKFLLILLAIGFLTIGIADPKTGSKIETVEQSGVDLYIALDLSKSMLAQDISPDRLGVAKQFVSRLIGSLEGSRVGLILFAGNAYKQVPLTLNHASALTDLKAADTDFIPKQGTAIGDAVDIAREAFALEFDPEEVNVNQSSQVLLLISDGEDHEGNATQAINLAREAGITIYTAGIGSEKGAPIPEKEKNGSISYKKDDEGNIILTKLNSSMLKGLAETGGGKFYQITSALDADQVIADLEGIEGGERQEQIFTEHEDLFQWFLLPALILIALEFVINEQSSQLFRKLIGWGGKDA
jgi:Ca-activated chloride channel family protein